MRTTFKYLPIDSLQKGQYQPREIMDDESLIQLKQSILSQGLIEPLIVREIVTNRYEIIAGERRWRAAKMAGLTEVPCLIGNYTDEQTCAVTLIENIQRQDLNPIEEATGYRRLMDEFRFLQEDIALMVGKSRSHIANILRLLTLDETVKQALRDRTFSLGHARVLVGLPSNEQIYFMHQTIECEWSVRQLEQKIKTHKQQVVTIQQKENRDVKRLERLLSDQAGTPVQILNTMNQGGWLQLQFFDNETLEGLLERLGLRYDE